MQKATDWGTDSMLAAGRTATMSAGPENSVTTYVLEYPGLVMDTVPLRKILTDPEAAGIEAHYFGDERSLASAVRENPPDVVMLDLTSRPDPWADFQSVKQLCVDIPLILLTGKVNESVGIAALKNGAHDFIIRAEATRAVLTRAIHYTVARKHAELAQLHSETKYRDLFENSPAAFYITTQDGSFVDANDACAQLLGFSKRELFDINTGELYCDPADRARLVATIENTGRLNNHEVRLRRKDGVAIDCQITASARIRPDGTVIYQGMIRDVTSERMLQAELNQAQKLESIGQLAAGIAHEINTPTQFVSDNTRFLKDSFAELLPVLRALARRKENAGGTDGETPDPLHALLSSVDLEFLMDEIPQAIDEAQQGLQRIAKIVRAMKEFSHPGQEDKTPIDINEAIQTTLTVSRNVWKYVADMDLRLGDNIPLVPALPAELNQVFLNMVVNAAHAIEDKVGKSGEKGTITIETSCDENVVLITIADTGSGIPDAVVHRIFDPFFTTKEVGRGTGQGLAIARSVVQDKHGGTIELETVPGEGTSFTIRLPLSEQGGAE